MLAPVYIRSLIFEAAIYILSSGNREPCPTWGWVRDDQPCVLTSKTNERAASKRKFRLYGEEYNLEAGNFVPWREGDVIHGLYTLLGCAW